MSVETLWRNRIVGTAEVAPDQLLANPKNWRLHPDHQKQALEGVLDEVGWVQQIIVNHNNQTVVDGHLRVSLALQRGETAIPVTYIDVTDEEESLILASLDPLAAMAGTDSDQLDALLREVETDNEAINQMLAELQESASPVDDNRYTREIEAPIYEPSGDCPALSSMFDRQRTEALEEAIEAAEDVTDEEKHFLRVAAQRHTVLHFGRIADYYSHASPAMQALMEESALVIIDYDRAIELGFVQLAESIAEQVKDEHDE